MHQQYFDQMRHCGSAQFSTTSHIRKLAVLETLRVMLSTGNRLKDSLSKAVANLHMLAVRLPEISTREVLTLKPHSDGSACTEALSPEQIETLTQVLELREAVFVKGLGWELPELRKDETGSYPLQHLVDERSIVILRDSEGKIVGSYSFKIASEESVVYNPSTDAVRFCSDYFEKQDLLSSKVASKDELSEAVVRLGQLWGIGVEQIRGNPLFMVSKAKDAAVSIRHFVVNVSFSARSQVQRRLLRLDAILATFTDIAFQSVVSRKRFILMQTHERFLRLLQRAFPSGVYVLAKSVLRNFNSSNEPCFIVVVDLRALLDSLSDRPYLYSLFGMRCKPLLLSSLASEDIP
jgi:hypothetical protein